MAVSLCIPLCIVPLFVSAAIAADEFVAKAPAPEPAPADAFLHEHGIKDHGEIFYYKRSENVTDCLQSADAKARLLQICQAREIFEQCAGEVDIYRFYDCQGDRCIASFSKNRSRCLLDKSGVGVRLAEMLGNTCNAAWRDHPLAEWNIVPWTEAIGGTNDFHCMTAMPLNTTLERRFICEGAGDPIIQHRMVFHSDDFLKTHERKVRCVATQHCGQPTIFAGEVACYELLPGAQGHSQGTEFSDQAPSDTINSDASSASSLSSCGCLRTSYISFLIAIVLVMTTVVV